MVAVAFTLRQAETITGLSNITLRRMIKAGKLRAVRVGRLLIPTSEVGHITAPGAVTESGRPADAKE